MEFNSEDNMHHTGTKPFEPKQFTVTKAASLSYGVGDTVKHIKFRTVS